MKIKEQFDQAVRANKVKLYRKKVMIRSGVAGEVATYFEVPA